MSAIPRAALRTSNAHVALLSSCPVALEGALQRPEHLSGREGRGRRGSGRAMSCPPAALQTRDTRDDRAPRAASRPEALLFLCPSQSCSFSPLPRPALAAATSKPA